MGKLKLDGDDGGLADELGRELARLRLDTYQEIWDLGEQAEDILRHHAPRGETGQIADNITPIVQGGTVHIVTHAEAPSGFDYVGVSRFGHDVEIIYPVQAKALKTKIGYRAWVRGFEPTEDWATEGTDEINHAATSAVENIGRGFLARVQL